MSLESCLKANKIAESLFKHQQTLLRQISEDEFTYNEQFEILVASVRLLTTTVYRSLSGDNTKVLDFLISGTEKSLREIIENTAPPKNGLN